MNSQHGNGNSVGGKDEKAFSFFFKNKQTGNAHVCEAFRDL